MNSWVAVASDLGGVYVCAPFGQRGISWIRVLSVPVEIAKLCVAVWHECGNEHVAVMWAGRANAQDLECVLRVVVFLGLGLHTLQISMRACHCFCRRFDRRTGSCPGRDRAEYVGLCVIYDHDTPQSGFGDHGHRSGGTLLRYRRRSSYYPSVYAPSGQ
jgi:hypothetical protein